MKQNVSVTMEKELVEWIDKQVETQRFRSRSHLVELALLKFRDREVKPTLVEDAGKAAKLHKKEKKDKL